MNRWIIASIVLFLCASAHAWNIPDGFKELKWGMSVDEVLNIWPYRFMGPHSSSSLPGLEIFYEWTAEGTPKLAIGKVPLKDIQLYFMNRKLAGVWLEFDSKHWSTLKKAMLVKFGQPTDQKTSIVQNPMGASFQKESLFWASKSLTIIASRFGSTISSGFIRYLTPTLVSIFERQEQREAEETAKDF